MSESVLHPLLQRLRQSCGRVVNDEEELDQLLGEPGDVVLFCGGDPKHYPECLDVAVILPELLASSLRGYRAAVIAPSLESSMQARYGFSRWPSLIFLRDGGYLGTISGMRDWSEYGELIAALQQAEVSRPATVGIPVHAAT